MLKAHAPDVSEARLSACQRVQSALYASGFPCPEPCLSPRRLGAGFATAESHLARGQRGDAHDPAIRDAIAACLAESIALAKRDPALSPGLGGSWFGGLPQAQLWPRAPAARLGFDAHADTAVWIDALARRARAVPLAGERVVAHFDIRAEHFLFEHGRVSSAYDWDSLHFEREPIAAGAAAHAFTAQWDREDLPPAPSLAEIFAFLAAYEHARGAPFDAHERRTAHAACVYALAFTARVEHGRAAPHPATASTAFRTLLRDAGEALLTA